MQDRRGLTVTTSSAAALAHYERAVDAQLHGWPGVLAALAEALADDPALPLAHALRALALAARGEGGEARAAIGLARREAARATARERDHIDLLGAIVEGRAADALRLVQAHAAQHPTDLLAASTALGAYGLYAFSGRADHDAARLAFVEALAARLPSDLPADLGGPWLLAQRGWAHIESGRVPEGLAMALEAIARRAENAFNAHIVVHGHHESGAMPQVLAFVDAWLPSYPRAGLMWGHLQWHAALAEIELGEPDRAVTRLVGPMLDYLPDGVPFMGLADIASLCWRLGLRGATGLPWAPIRAHAERHFAAGSNVFGELHLAMVNAAHGDAAGLAVIARRLRKVGAHGHEGAAVALAWVEGLAAMLAGDGERAAMHLSTCAAGSVRLGGSRAQRGIVEATRAARQVPRA